MAGEGGRKVESPPPFFFLCHTKLVRAAGAHMETQSHVCSDCVHTQSPWHTCMSCAYRRRETVQHTACSPLDCFIPALLTVLSKLV